MLLIPYDKESVAGQVYTHGAIKEKKQQIGGVERKNKSA